MSSCFPDMRCRQPLLTAVNICKPDHLQHEISRVILILSFLVHRNQGCIAVSTMLSRLDKLMHLRAWEIQLDRLSDFHDLEEAISTLCKAVDLTPNDHANKPG